MLLNNLYFRVKPLIPRSIRLSVRRQLSLRKLERVRDTWPIMLGSERPPEGWQGWPEGKKFAFVLTHDVESAAGLDRVRQLAEMEMELGFRSSFNFVPEGDYRVPKELRDWLTDNGFEVGVHDLHHDGQLFSSREGFLRKAQRINSHLETWNAIGFRSGFMLRNLDWLSELNIAYDMSTFDTDPFEPQPDGVNTIFPFWVPRGSEVGDQRSEIGGRPCEPRCGRSESRSATTRSRDNGPLTRTAQSDSINYQHSTLNEPRSGYAELPYTLPQDSTLFLLLRETTIDIWKRKLDWIVANRGMALVNVHPDYIQFEDATASKHTYSVRFFTQLLHYVGSHYGDSVWNGLPSDIAAFAAAHQSRGMLHQDDAPFWSAMLAEEPTTPAVNPGSSPAQHMFAGV